ncbi:phage major tail tube protein [Kiloniella sp. b19]|uniref:phage major tail tube protein n=1 Tax=Kiloniella sp. GXU_MW_B19 TaxID=3141326 RepID=UPI0031CEDDF5
MIPQTINKCNLFVDGNSFAGIAKEITLPKVMIKTEDFQGAGMLAPAELEAGLDKLEMAVVFQEYNLEILRQFGTFSPEGALLRWRGAAQREGDDTQVDAVEITTRGRLKELDFGSSKQGENNSLSVTYPLTYFKYDLNGETIIEIDIVNMIFVVDGEDRYAAIRTALGI